MVLFNFKKVAVEKIKNKKIKNVEKCDEEWKATDVIRL